MKWASTGLTRAWRVQRRLVRFTTDSKSPTTAITTMPSENTVRGKSPSSDVDEEALFAQLEAEIENDDDAVVRESSMAQFRKE